ncbi:MAG TPA: hypothetical protein VII58_03225 [Acidobacteriaceae bacterium]
MFARTAVFILLILSDGPTVAHCQIKATPISSRSPAQTFPRISGMADVVPQMHINQLLAERENQDRAQRLDCLRTHPPGMKSSFSESIHVAYLSKRFLSIEVSASWDGCAAYPNLDISKPLTINLTTGAQIDWDSFFSAPLVEKYLRRASLDRDCAQIINRPETQFSFWLDGKARRLMVKPDLPHVTAACATLTGIPFSELRGLVKDSADMNDLLRYSAAGN